MEDLVVVAFERRGRLGLGALKTAGEKNARLVDDEGETLKVGQEKVLHRFAARVPDGDARLVKERLRGLASTLGAARPEAIDLDLLWSTLDDERVYTLRELAESYFGDARDGDVAALVRALAPQPAAGEKEEPVHHFRTRQGGLVRTDAETLGKIRAKLEGERKRREAEAHFREWLAARQPSRPDAKAGAAPPEHAELLHVLTDFALGGDKARDAARGRRLARDVGFETEDEALNALERLELVPKDVNELPHRAGIPIAFPSRVRQDVEARLATPRPLDVEGEGRRDFRGELTTAIDDATTQDVDDAFSFREEGGVTVLSVHIADVAFELEAGSDLDAEARKRATSVYFPGDTIPMLPWGLTRERLSLDAGADRRVVSLVARIRPDLTLEGTPALVRGVARVGRRLTYEESPEPPEEWRGPLAFLHRFALALRARRVARGAILLELPDLKITLDERGEPEVSLRQADTLGHLVVSELMILYNAAVAARLAEARAPALFRQQPEPAAVTMSPEDPLFPVRARKGLPPSLVSIDPGPHRTLGLDAYVQASSPIRRYGDLVAQRQLTALLAGRPAPLGRDDVEAIRSDVERVEKTARRLEDDRDVYWVCRWLESHRQTALDGIVSRTGREGRGLVFLPLLRLELPLGAAREDQDLPAEGTAVKVRVKRCSPRRRSATFELLEPPPPAV